MLFASNGNSRLKENVMDRPNHSRTVLWIAVLLLMLAAFLIAWGIQPKRTEAFVGRLPYGGNYILKALAKLDSMLSRWS